MKPVISLMNAAPGHLSSGLAIAGKFAMAGLFSVIFIYTSELYPTVIRYEMFTDLSDNMEHLFIACTFFCFCYIIYKFLCKTINCNHRTSCGEIQISGGCCILSGDDSKV